MKKISGILLLVLALSSCTAYQKALKSKDSAYKIEAANSFYEQGKYNKAVNLYESIADQDAWKPNMQPVYINFIRAEHKRKRYESLSGLIAKFKALYPTSTYLEEVSYLEVETLYSRSEEYTNDQLVTLEGIQKFKEFLEKFPESKNKEQAEKYLKELEEKIELKAFDAAKLYNKIGEFTRDYNAAIIALDNFILDYPGSKYKEDALYYKLDSAYKLAINSVYSKMEQRLKDCLTYHEALLSFNKDTKYKEKATNIYTRVTNELKQFSKK